MADALSCYFNTICEYLILVFIYPLVRGVSNPHFKDPDPILEENLIKIRPLRKMRPHPRRKKFDDDFYLRK